jgi:hypothetical protein
MDCSSSTPQAPRATVVVGQQTPRPYRWDGALLIDLGLERALFRVRGPVTRNEINIDDPYIGRSAH